MPIDIKLSKSDLSKIIQVDEFFSKTLGNLDKKALLQLLFLWLKVGKQEKDLFYSFQIKIRMIILKL